MSDKENFEENEDIFGSEELNDENLFEEFEEDNNESEDDFLEDDFLLEDDGDDIKSVELDIDEDELFNADDTDDLLEEKTVEEDDIFSSGDDSTEEDDIFSSGDDSTIEDDMFSSQDDLPMEETEIVSKETKSENNNEEVKSEELEKIINEEKNLPEKEKKTEQGFNIKSVIAVAAITSLVSMGGSYALLNDSNKDEKLNKILSVAEKNQTDLVSMENTVLNAVESSQNLNYEMALIKKKQKDIENIEGEVNSLKKYMVSTIKRVNSNKSAYSKLNTKINNLPSSNVQIAEKLVELEKSLSKLDNYDQYQETIKGLKKAVRNQQNNIDSMKKKVKTNMAKINKSEIAYKDINQKALKNAQKITQNIKGIRNVNQKVMGESSVKDLLRKTDSASKDVRAVSLLFDNNKTIEVQNENIGYNIIGSIVSEIFFVLEEDGSLTSYEIGGFIEGYGIIRDIRENKVIETDAGIIYNTNNDVAR